jgi:hypothetical protein
MITKPETTPRACGHTFHIDSFESELENKQHGDAEAVMREVVRGGRFSAFEMTMRLYNTLRGLVTAGRIEETPSAYPWHNYRTK